MTTISSRALDNGEICRLCLSEDDNLVSIFKDEQDEEERMPMATRIMTIAPVEIHENDGLPDLVCTKCVLMLDQTFKFRDQCERSDALLRHHFGQLWPETNPQLQKLLKEKKLVRKNLNAEFPVSENYQEEATCLVTVKQEKDDADDGSQSPIYQDNFGKPQNYSMDDDITRRSKLVSGGSFINDKHSLLSSHLGYLNMNNLKKMFERNRTEQQEPISLAVRNNKSMTASKAPVASPDDASHSSSYEDDYDQPQDYSMDDDGSRKSKDLVEKSSALPPPFGYLDIGSIKNMFHPNESPLPDPVSLALRETQNTIGPKILPSPLTIPNISVSLIRKNNIAREAQAQAEATQSKSRRWRKTNEPCTICGKCFKDRFAMKVHLRTHSGEKPFVCQVCGKAFRQKAHLGKHNFTHSGQRKQPQQSQGSQVASPQQQSSASTPQSSSNNLLTTAEVKAKLARLSTSVQTKPLPKLEPIATSNPQPITVPIPVLPRLQKQGLQQPESPGLPDTDPRPSTPEERRDSSSISSKALQSSPLQIPKTSVPLILPKPTINVPKVPGTVSSSSVPAVAYYVMANGLLPQNVVVGNGTGLKKESVD